MGFDTESLSLKVSHGNEIRRLTLQGVSYAALRTSVAELFGMDQALLSLKYQDDDEDKISMTSDEELQEAVRFSKRVQKVLRLFVELKQAAAPAPAPAPASAPEAPAPAPVPEEGGNDGVHHGPGSGFCGRGGGGYPFPPFHRPPFAGGHHGPFARGHHGPFAGGHPLGPFAGGHPHGPFPGHLGPFLGGQFPHPHPHPHHGGPHGPWGEKHHGPEHHHRQHPKRSPHERPCERVIRSEDGNVFRTFSSSSGTFSSAEEGRGDMGLAKEQLKQYWKEERKAYKESKRAMKESWRQMKKEAATEEDKAALKQLKHHMKHEMKQAFIADIKGDKHAFKALKHSEKEKKTRFIARHVEDVTIPDGTELPPNAPFIKTWKLRNEGPAWPPGSHLVLMSHKGDNLNGPERVVIQGDVLPGQEVAVSVPLITPAEPGRYVGYYRMVTPDGVKFGQRVWVSFVVRQREEIPRTSSTAVANVCDVDM